MTTKLILIRHGATKWNLEKRYTGFSDLCLHYTGIEQAKLLCKRLKNEVIYKIYSSDRKRAIQTAKIIFKDRKIHKSANLRELHFGIFEGLNYKEIMEKYPVIYRKWLDNPFYINIPKGEKIKDFRKRIINSIKKIISANNGKTIAIVSHGGAISIFINHILKSKNFWKTIPGSASLSIVEFNNNKFKIKNLNDISHLNG